MPFEFTILDFIQNNLRCGFLDFIMPKITALGNAGILWILLTLVFLISKKYRKTGIVMMLALVLDLIFCNILIKPIVARTRPYDINTAVTLLINRPGDYSFPSGHTAASFASIAAMYFTKTQYRTIALVLGIVIAFSRLYLYVHFPTDVLGGIVIGLFCGWLAFKIYNKFTENRKTVKEN